MASLKSTNIGFCFRTCRVRRGRVGLGRRWSGRGSRAIPTLDKNGDGKISKEEFPGNPAGFERLDADKDGFITLEEIAWINGGAGGGTAGERFKTLDKNGDGKISKEEFPGRPAGFERLDADKDGFLTPAELALGSASGQDEAALNLPLDHGFRLVRDTSVTCRK